MGYGCHHFTLCCSSDLRQFLSYALLEILKRLATGRSDVWVSLEPGSSDGGISRFDFIPGAAFPLAKIDLTQGRTNLYRQVVLHGNHRLSGLDGPRSEER